MAATPPGRPNPPGKPTGSVPQQKPGATGKVPPAAPKPASGGFDADDFLILDADAPPAKPAGVPPKAGATGKVPPAGTARVPTVPPKAGATGKVPAAGTARVPMAPPKTGATGKVPTAATGRVPAAGGTGKVPTAPPKAGATGKVPAAATGRVPAAGGTGKVPTAPPKAGGTSRIQTVPGKAGTTGRIPTAPPKTGGTGRIQTLPGKTGTTGTVPITTRPGATGKIPQAGSKTTGRRRTRTGRTASVSQRMQKQSKKSLRMFQAVVAILGGLIILGGGGYLLIPEDTGMSEGDKNELLNNISDCLKEYDQKQYIASDDRFHNKIEVLIKNAGGLGRIDDEEVKEAVRKITAYHQSEIHPAAGSEVEAEKIFKTWLPKVEAFLKLPDPRPKDMGIQLYDVAYPAMQKYPSYSRADKVTKHLETLEQYKSMQEGNPSRTKYTLIGRELRPLVREKRYGPIIKRWKEAKEDAEITDEGVQKEIDNQIKRYTKLATFELDKQTRLAEQQRDDLDDKPGGLKILEEIFEKLKGCELEQKCAERIKDYNAGKKSGI